ncbi:MAG: pirin family protein [Cyclobacteriaceae bacterium]
MKYVEHKANTRGTANFGWLDSKHTFSFGHYYDPARVHFGALRVLNDDIVTPGNGFGTHPHDNMEIVSIPLSGALAHKDSTGTVEEIQTGEVQIMSAGSGLTHSEFNASKTEHVNFLQIWVLPKEKNIEPRYEQKMFAQADRHNAIQTLVAPDQPGALWINQDAKFSMVQLEKGKTVDYALTNSSNGVYLFLIAGKLSAFDLELNERDGVGIWEIPSVPIAALKDAELLLIEVPMLQ